MPLDTWGTKSWPSAPPWQVSEEDPKGLIGVSCKTTRTWLVRHWVPVAGFSCDRYDVQKEPCYYSCVLSFGPRWPSPPKWVNQEASSWENQSQLLTYCSSSLFAQVQSYAGNCTPLASRMVRRCRLQHQQPHIDQNRGRNQHACPCKPAGNLEYNYNSDIPSNRGTYQQWK